MSQEKPCSFDQPHELLCEEKLLILYNDDINTFEFVIESLVEVCKHEPEQAEQCALTAHFNGKCNVNVGSFIELKPRYDSLCDRGLSVSIV
ncbi:MAG: ATP-dependent Clp protease adaptor ClpS [Bacteroidales bacterium]|nr:ATP-dependent Clp protease adaptor ClpS [Bacteroidales bacterium]MDZ4204728.1 ATP-dependent Clp protease adaptor ClpS [Bacteroidales bacterium]